MQSPQHAADALNVISCPPEQRREALLQLAAAHDPAQQTALGAAINAMTDQPNAQWDGLLIGRAGTRLVGAIWVQALPLNMAQLWLPDAQGEHRNALIEAARAWVMDQRRTLCHVEISPDATRTRAQLLAHGMKPLVSLHCLKSATDNRLPGKAPAASLRWAPWEALTPAQQHDLLAAVEHESLDCCVLREILSVEDLLAGFYQQDALAPAHWYALWVDDSPTPVGVLLLAPRHEINRWELMLMGVVPEWRRQGLGQHIINHALALAEQAGAEELLLSVDHDNTPAFDLYSRAGFSEYARQQVLAWRG
ncbi:GNAT family N-acetyltransferase [Vreelandella gomseomensis]|uniref:GNAT family N-acetyltransferase n=1 Tax=Vreelandella gomseomensis TaxID=370766 RepID=A0ABU1GB96_9GAMM|nr:GNAT family N-acetyltransferase [Halomonas gomseomensis]MDR5874349.1 GNAT family N-acetyltransferase [Halomonas gomseomensis]